MLTFFLDTFFPRRCVGCGREGLSWLCQECLTPELAHLTEPYPGVWALSSFHQPLIREAIHGLKYHSLHELASELVIALWSPELPIKSPLLVPVPTSFKRQKTRGYNQAELVARAIQQVTGWEIATNLLVKTAKGSQVGKTRQERQAAGYKLRPKTTIPDREILLVDDLCTTGSTITACRRALGREVPALVLAVEE